MGSATLVRLSICGTCFLPLYLFPLLLAHPNEAWWFRQTKHPVIYLLPTLGVLEDHDVSFREMILEMLYYVVLWHFVHGLGISSDFQRYSGNKKKIETSQQGLSEYTTGKQGTFTFGFWNFSISGSSYYPSFFSPLQKAKWNWPCVPGDWSIYFVCRLGQFQN